MSGIDTHLQQSFKQSLVALVLLVLPLGLWSQERSVWVEGTVRGAESGELLPGAHISLLSSGAGQTVNEEGKFAFALRLKRDVTLVISFLGYSDQYLPIAYSSGSVDETDTLSFDIKLATKAFVSDTVNVEARKPAPDTVFGTSRFSISDYLFFRSGFLMLVYPKRLEKESFLVYTDSTERIIASIVIPGKSKRLFSDYEDRPFVITDRAAFEIQFDEVSEELVLLQIDYEQFQSTIEPGIDTLSDHILFSDYRWYYPLFHYYGYKQGVKDPVVIKQIINAELYRRHRFEYYFLSPRQKLQARQVARELGADKHDVAAFMSGFADDITFEPLCAPLFVHNDSILIFDYQTDQVHVLDDQFEQIDSIPISCHKTKTGLKWERAMVADEERQIYYACFSKHGFSYLKQLDLTTGASVATLRLTHRYPEKVRIRNGKVYYIHRPKDSLQKKFLYSESLDYGVRRL